MRQVCALVLAMILALVACASTQLSERTPLSCPMQASTCTSCVQHWPSPMADYCHPNFPWHIQHWAHRCGGYDVVTGPGLGDAPRLYFYAADGSLAAVEDITYFGETCVAGPASFAVPARCNDRAVAGCCDVTADVDFGCLRDGGHD